MRTRILAAAFGVLAVAWPFLGWVTGHFADVPMTDQWVLVSVTLLTLVFTPAVVLETRLATMGAAVAGLINFSSAIFTFAETLEIDFGRGILAVFAFLFMFFALQSYKQTRVPTLGAQSKASGPG